MDWIERWFGISPDGGDGSTELLYIGAVLGTLALIAVRRLLLKFARKRLS